MKRTYRDKVEWLLKYCSDYDGHEFMYDEHVADEKGFDIETSIGRQLIHEMSGKKIIVLTGDAGDGKSRLMNRIRRSVNVVGTSWQYTNDFSELSAFERKKVLCQMEAVIDGDTDEHLFIAANSGIFISEIMQHKKGLLKKLEGYKDALIVDFSRRNLAANAEEFFEIVDTFFECEGVEPCTNCSLEICPYKRNLDLLTERTELGNRRKEQLRMVYDALFLDNIHVTFRDLLSSLAYLITAGVSCHEMQEMKEKKEYYFYDNLFDYDKKKDRLRNKIRDLDPAKKDHKRDRQIYLSEIHSLQLFPWDAKEKFKSLIRKKYFDSPDELLTTENKRYNLLNFDYMDEYKRVIEKLKRDGFLDATEQEYEILWKFELGINRIFNPERSDAQMVLFDSPLIISPKVRIEHEAGEELFVYFSTREHFYEKESPLFGNDINTFYFVSLAENEKDGKIYQEKMLVDYELFRQIMMAADNRYDLELLRRVDDRRIKSFISKTFRHVTNDGKMRVQWLGDAKKQYATFELYPMRQIGLKKWANRERGGRTYRVGKG